MRRTTAFLFTVLVVALSGLAVGTASPAGAIVDRDCDDFSTQAAAQRFFIDAGGPQNDPHRLDADGDGVACDSNPCPCDTGTGGGGGGNGDGGGGGEDPVRTNKARVIRVVDGDTVKVRLVGGARRTVRMLGIDTPEVHGTVECGGPQASRSLKKLLPRGAVVWLKSDPSQADKDRYGRILRYVARNGRDTNRAQVARGWSRAYVYDDPFRRLAEYRRSERQARAHDLGIWGLC